jgi:magnesium-transporting ATPase (P-type)
LLWILETILTSWFTILGAFLVETAIAFLVNPREALKTPPKNETESISNRATELHSQALSLVALVVAVVSIIFSQSGDEMSKSGMTLLGLSAGFLIISHQSNNLVHTRFIWSQLQERTMEYGGLALFSGLILLYRFYTDAGIAVIILYTAFIVVLAIRFNAVQKVVRSNFRKWKKQECVSRKRWLLNTLANYARTTCEKYTT